MTKPRCLDCPHLAEIHEPTLGYCDAPGCRCMALRLEEWDEDNEPDDGPAELDFDAEC